MGRHGCHRVGKRDPPGHHGRAPRHLPDRRTQSLSPPSTPVSGKSPRLLARLCRPDPDPDRAGAVDLGWRAGRRYPEFDHRSLQLVTGSRAPAGERWGVPGPASRDHRQRAGPDVVRPVPPSSSQDILAVAPDPLVAYTSIVLERAGKGHPSSCLSSPRL